MVEAAWTNCHDVSYAQSQTVWNQSAVGMLAFLGNCNIHDSYSTNQHPIKWCLMYCVISAITYSVANGGKDLLLLTMNTLLQLSIRFILQALHVGTCWISCRDYITLTVSTNLLKPHMSCTVECCMGTLCYSCPQAYPQILKTAPPLPCKSFTRTHPVPASVLPCDCM